LITYFVYPQSKSNLEIFYSLIDSSVSGIIKNIPEDKKTIELKLTLGNTYTVFNNKIIKAFQAEGRSVEFLDSTGSHVNYVIDNAKVEYGEIFRKGFLGEYYIPRNISLSGNYILNSKEIKFTQFNYAFADTIAVDELKEIENTSFPFTQGEIPAEPFFSGLIEPIVAIGAAAAAIILFFTVRSK